jgi:hypothetical protein
MEAPFHIVTNEFFHQFRAMGIQESSQGLGKKFSLVSEPAFFDKGFGFFVKLIGYFGLHRFH